VNIKVKAHKSLRTCRRASGVMGGLKPKVALCLLHPTILHLCISSLVAL
jgi:hypothetical protein